MTISLTGPFTFTSSRDFGELGITHCKHEETGAGDIFCPPIQGEFRWRTPSLPVQVSERRGERPRQGQNSLDATRRGINLNADGNILKL
jgi:hypothetical protein